jgi:hypothetical protein
MGVGVAVGVEVTVGVGVGVTFGVGIGVDVDVGVGVGVGKEFLWREEARPRIGLIAIIPAQTAAHTVVIHARPTFAEFGYGSPNILPPFFAGNRSQQSM